MKAKQKATFRMRPISTYLFSLSVVAFLLMSIPLAWVCYEVRTYVDAYKIYICVGVLLFVYLITCIINSFWFFGLYKINNTGISFYAPFRKSIHIQYNTIRYIGIDFGVVSGSRQFWIYFSTEPIPAKYIHKINGMPVNRKCVRIQYSDKRFNELLSVLPEKQKKELSKGSSVLRVYPE